MLDFINTVMISIYMKTFKAVEIINPSPKAGFSLNLKKHYKDKETILDVSQRECRAKCITKKWNCSNYRSSITGQFQISRKNTLLLGYELQQTFEKVERYEELNPVIYLTKY